MNTYTLSLCVLQLIAESTFDLVAINVPHVFPKYLVLERRFHSPIVDINVELNASSENLKRTHVFPTPESPISKSLNK